jgi:hypothetical protein
VSSEYVESKLLAERAAFDFVEERRKNNLPCFELCVKLNFNILVYLMSLTNQV